MSKGLRSNQDGISVKDRTAAGPVPDGGGAQSPSGTWATAAQGAKADSAVQPGSANAVPDAGSATDGEVLTLGVSGLPEWAPASGGGSGASGTVVGATGTQSLGSGSNQITFWDSEDSNDTLGAWSSANASRMTAPSTGLYLVIANLQLSAFTANYQAIKFKVNGSQVLGVFGGPEASSSAGRNTMSSMVVFLSAGDYVEVYMDLSSPSTTVTVTGNWGTTSGQSRFEMVKLA